ncbi:hypothetical protein FXO37_16318 [Capsicum annuum]|nr:hypothetical protein FXO37_16318 [Capsicum annuum]
MMESIFPFGDIGALAGVLTRQWLQFGNLGFTSLNISQVLLPAETCGIFKKLSTDKRQVKGTSGLAGAGDGDGEGEEMNNSIPSRDTVGKQTVINLLQQQHPLIVQELLKMELMDHLVQTA